MLQIPQTSRLLEDNNSMFLLFNRYLTGNPCTDFEGYRQYTIATLPNLNTLDGTEIDKSERIVALQDYKNVEAKIQHQQNEYLQKQKDKKKESDEQLKANEQAKNQDKELKENRKENWYTDIPGEKLEESKGVDEEEELEAEKRFWEEKVEYTPESRLELHKHIEEIRKAKENKNKNGLDSTKMERVIRYFTDDGRPLNLNQGKWDFLLEDDEDNNSYLLDFSCYKHIDTSLMDVDVQPRHIRIIVKGKVFQLALSEEVKPDSSTAKRSQITGHLLVTMPKMNQVLNPPKKSSKTIKPTTKTENKNRIAKETPENSVIHEKLEVNLQTNNDMDFGNIVQAKFKTKPTIDQKKVIKDRNVEEESEKDFIDDPDVPPLI